VSPSFFSPFLAACGGEQKKKKRFFGDTPNPGKGRLPFAIPLKNREVDAKGGTTTLREQHMALF